MTVEKIQNEIQDRIDLLIKLPIANDETVSFLMYINSMLDELRGA